MYDFSDPLIRDMVENCHRPTEVTVTDERGTTVLEVICVKDARPWPCDPISEWRTWQANNTGASGEAVG